MPWYPCCCRNISCVSCSNIPTTLNGVFSLASNCGCSNTDLNGATVTFTYDSGSSLWKTGSQSICYNMASFTRILDLACTDATHMTLTVPTESGLNIGSTYACAIGSGSPYLSTSLTCSPFQVVFSGTVTTLPISGVACPCAGVTWTLTITA